MNSATKILLVALAAGVLGVIAGLRATGPGPLLRSELGQRILGATLAARAPKPPTGTAIATRGEPIPAMTVADVEGRAVTLPGAYSGRRILINLWASWCAPCVKEMPELQRFSATQGRNGVQVVGIALDDPAAVRAFLRRVAVSYPILLDTPGPTDAGVRLGNPQGVLPYSVLVSAEGRLLRQRIGPFDDGEIMRWAAE